MMSLTRQNFVQGIVLKKTKYRDYHEILQILTEHGHIETFFYENVYKNKKKAKVSVPYNVAINYFPTSGMNKITNLEIDNSFGNAVYDVIKNSYAVNIAEYILHIQFFDYNIYQFLKTILTKLNDETNEKLLTTMFIMKILKQEGFIFKYQKTKIGYVGYSFLKNSFVDKTEIDNTVFYIDNKLVKLIYYLSINSLDFLDSIDISIEDSQHIFSFINILLKEYAGIETKSYYKIIELEEMLGLIKRKDN